MFIHLPGVFIAGYLCLGRVLLLGIAAATASRPPPTLNYVPSVHLIPAETMLDPSEGIVIGSLSLLHSRRRADTAIAPALLQVLGLDLPAAVLLRRIKFVIVRRIVVVVG